MRNDVRIDWTGAVVCPFHGPQDSAEYLPGVAPCGCQWAGYGRHGLLRALPGSATGRAFATEIAPIGDLAHMQCRKNHG